MLRQTRTAEITVREGIIISRIAPRVHQTVDDARENLTGSAAAGEGRRLPLLVDIRKSERLDAEVRHIYTGESLTQSFTAIAILVAGSPVGRLMGNLYILVARPGIPMKLFDDENAALAWLGAHRA